MELFRKNVITHLSDVDLYKLTMLQIFFKKYHTHKGVYKYHCRSKHNLIPYINEIENEIKHLCTLRFTNKELDHIESLGHFDSDFISYLKSFQLDYNFISVAVKDGKLDIIAYGDIINAMMFEVYILAIVSEVYDRNVYKDININIAKDKLKNKIQLIKDFCDEYNNNIFKYIDMGTRRRFSFLWQDYTIKYQLDNLSRSVFLGTSNIYFSMKYKCKCFGTQAHEIQSFYQSICHIKDSLSKCFDDWIDVYGANLGTVLSDTLTVDVFLQNFKLKYASLFNSVREDSAKDVFNYVDKIVKHYIKLIIDPLTKAIIFSNSLNIPKAITIARYCLNKIGSSFGIGTDLTNDMGEDVEPVQSIMKLIFAGRSYIDLRPVCKISDDPVKSMGGSEYQIKYVKDEFRIK